MMTEWGYGPIPFVGFSLSVAETHGKPSGKVGIIKFQPWRFHAPDLPPPFPPHHHYPSSGIARVVLGGTWKNEDARCAVITVGG
jgi:hypothetical protein